MIDLASEPPQLILSPNLFRDRTAALHPIVVDSLVAFGLPSTGRLFEHSAAYVSQEIRKSAHSLGINANQGALVRWYQLQVAEHGRNFGPRLPAASSAAEVAALSPIEQKLLVALEGQVPSAAVSYRQALRDLEEEDRLSFRGTANELRGVLWDVLETLAPDGAVMAQPNFRLEDGQRSPTHRQKARYVLENRRRSERDTAEETFDIIEGRVAALSRLLYGRTSSSSHLGSPLSEVRQVKMYLDAFLAEVFEIHRA